MDIDEPLLQDNDQRFVLYPIKYDDIWACYTDILKNYWRCDSLAFMDWEKGIDQQELALLRKILSFLIIYSDQKFLFQLNSEIQIPEARSFLGYKIYNNIQYMELFSIMCRTISVEKVVNTKLWLAQQIFAEEPFGCRIVAYTAMQCVFTCSIYLLKKLLEKSSKADAVNKHIKLVLRDKIAHVQFGVVLMRHCVNKPTSEKIRSIVRSFVDVEIQFLLDLIGERSCGFDRDSVTQFVQTMGNKLCALFD